MIWNLAYKSAGPDETGLGLHNSHKVISLIFSFGIVLDKRGIGTIFFLFLHKIIYCCTH